MLRFGKMAQFAGLLSICGGLGGCSADASSPDRTVSENAGSVRVPLTTTGNLTHAQYKLGPASFLITGQPGGPFQPLTVSADGQQSSLEVPLNPGYYSIALEDGWTLQQGTPGAGGAGTQWSPVAASLTSPNPMPASVQQYQSTDVTFIFHLGVSSVNLGIGVDEGPPSVPAGYDGVIWPTVDPAGQWQITFNYNYNNQICCWATPAAAQAQYPNSKLFVSM
jgi:hypothetical protein